MLSEYIDNAMSLSEIEKMDDGRYFASIPGFKSLWADGDTWEECLSQLRDSLVPL